MKISAQKSLRPPVTRRALALVLAAILVAAATTLFGELSVPSSHGHDVEEHAEIGSHDVETPAEIGVHDLREPAETGSETHRVPAASDHAEAADDELTAGDLAGSFLVSAAAAALILLGFALAGGTPSAGTFGDLRIGVALLSVGAATIHFAVISQHLAEWWLEGVYFAVVAVLQLAWALAVALAPSVRIYLTGAIGNALVALTWLVSRTTGIPFGPDAGEPEPVGVPDALASAFELGLVIAALALMLTARARREPRAFPPSKTHSWGLASLVAGLSGLSLLVLAGL